MLRLLNIASSIIWSVKEKLAEEVSSPFNTMFNLIREISQCAHRDCFFRRVLGISIALSFVRDNHLRIGFRSKSS